MRKTNLSLSLKVTVTSGDNPLINYHVQPMCQLPLDLEDKTRFSGSDIDKQNIQYERTKSRSRISVQTPISSKCKLK